jgi:hypothetical protein
MSDSLIFNQATFHHTLAEQRPKLTRAHEDLLSIISHALECIEPDDPLRKSFNKFKRSLTSTAKQLSLLLTELTAERPLPPGPN